MYQVPSKYPFAARVNQYIAWDQMFSSAQIKNQVRAGWGGDPNDYSNPAIGGIHWNAMTSTQQLVAQWYEESGQNYPDNLNAILRDCAGPNHPWNWSNDEWIAAGVIQPLVGPQP